MKKKHTIRATLTQAWWEVDPDDEVTPSVRIVLPDETEFVLRDQIANGWTVERMTPGAGVDLATRQRSENAAKNLHGDDADIAFHAYYGADAEFDFAALQQVRATLMRKGSEFFQNGYAQPIEVRIVNSPV